MLDLVLLERNGQAFTRDYTRIIREQLLTNQSYAATRRQALNDPAGAHSVRP